MENYLSIIGEIFYSFPKFANIKIIWYAYIKAEK